MKALQTKIKELKEQHAEEFVQDIFDSHDQKQKAESLMLIGGIKAIDRLTANLSSQVIMALMKVEETKAYLHLGYSRFVDFLNDSDFSDLSKTKFYRQRELLLNEGPELYDLFSENGIPASKRKLIGAGQVELDDDNVIVKFSDDEQLTFPKTDFNKLVETISALADANADKSKKLTRGQADNDRLKRRIVALNEEVGSEIVASHDEIETCYIVVGTTMKRLNLLLEDATLVRVSQFEQKSLRVLAAQYQQLNKIIAAKMGDTVRADLTDSEEDRLASLLGDED